MVVAKFGAVDHSVATEGAVESLLKPLAVE